jgi:hypothetical protein
MWRAARLLEMTYLPQTCISVQTIESGLFYVECFTMSIAAISSSGHHQSKVLRLSWKTPPEREMIGQRQAFLRNMRALRYVITSGE